ncbi:response regulator [Salipiger sp. IMCC34102]|uniref:response regulator n=1 Tax=Salipiger sp. IMCC34102 TaxID=2510647 RepID=UPI00101DCB87|nr:response regulator [Salipiger sp. IMCC34102]RYH01438.1 response regulator [Salipiger sp. IMCC34102]
MRILAVDDDPIILELLASPMYLGSDHDVTCAGSAAEAVDELDATEATFDSILLDIDMPVRNGIDLCAEIRQRPPYATTPILMITATREAETMQRAYSAGATDFISKPLDGVEVGARISLATMLNDSLARERQMRAAFDRLQKYVAAGFDHRTASVQAGPLALMALQNRLLHLEPGVHALSMFSVHFAALAEFEESPQGGDLLRRIARIGAATTSVLAYPTSTLAYAGRGLFLGVTFGRRREVLDVVQKKAAAAIRKMWAEHDLPDPVPVPVCDTVSNMGVWTGRDASEELESYACRTIPDFTAIGPRRHVGDAFSGF